MSKILKFGVGAAVAALTTGLGLASAYAAYTPPALGSPQQNMGHEAAGPGLKISHINVSASAVGDVFLQAGYATVYDIQISSTSLAAIHFYSGVTAAPTCSLTTVAAVVPVSIGASRLILNDQYGIGLPGGGGFCVTALPANGDTTTLGGTAVLDVYYR